MRSTSESTNGSFGLMEHWEMPPGFVSPYHRHHLEDEGFYVLEGEMAFVCDGKWMKGGPGTYVFTGQSHRMTQPDAYRMIQRHARAAGIKTKIGNHSLRATGITDYLKNAGTLEHAQAMANHSSPRTTKLYDRRGDELSLYEYERVGI